MTKTKQEEKIDRQQKHIEKLERQVYQLRQVNLDLQQEGIHIRRAALINEILAKYPDMLNIQPSDPGSNGQQQNQKKEKNSDD